jgi:penicillin-binding protein 2
MARCAQYERKPLLDKAMSGTYPPGLDLQADGRPGRLAVAGVNPDERVPCSAAGSSAAAPGVAGAAARRENMHDAIKNSCDIYFYQTALKIGPDPIAAAAHAFGLGGTFDIGIPGQKKGIVGSKEWKRKANRDPRNQPWFAGDTVNYGIGQGLITVNPLQSAVMTARLANGQKALNPRLIKSVGGVDQPHGDAVPDLPYPKDLLEYVRGGMIAVANDTSGTAYRQSQLGLGDLQMAGKTGTAQVRIFKEGESRKSSGVPLGPEGPQLVHRLRADRRAALRHLGADRARRPWRRHRRRAARP